MPIAAGSLEMCTMGLAFCHGSRVPARGSVSRESPTTASYALSMCPMMCMEKQCMIFTACQDATLSSIPHTTDVALHPATAPASKLTAPAHVVHAHCNRAATHGAHWPCPKGKGKGESGVFCKSWVSSRSPPTIDIYPFTLCMLTCPALHPMLHHLHLGGMLCPPSASASLPASPAGCSFWFNCTLTSCCRLLYGILRPGGLCLYHHPTQKGEEEEGTTATCEPHPATSAAATAGLCTLQALQCSLSVLQHVFM